MRLDPWKVAVRWGVRTASTDNSQYQIPAEVVRKGNQIKSGQPFFRSLSQIWAVTTLDVI